MNIGTIRTDLQTRLAAVSGLNAYDTVPANPQLPAAVVRPSEVIYHSTFEAGSAEVRFEVQLLAQFADFQSAQNLLDSYIDVGTTNSVIDALENNQTGGEEVTVERIHDYGRVSYDDADYLAVSLDVLILTSS